MQIFNCSEKILMQSKSMVNIANCYFEVSVIFPKILYYIYGLS
jgi:hypothetical protein